jgi:DNA polymerase-1
MEKTMAEVNKLPLAVAKQALESYRRGMPELKPWWDRVWNQLCQTRSLRTVLGRYRFFMDRLGEYQGELHRTAVAQEPQSVVGDIINRALTICDEILPREVETRLQVHDEIVFNCPENLVSLVVPIIRRVMEYPIRFDGVEHRMVIPAEISVGKNWYDQKVVEYK